MSPAAIHPVPFSIFIPDTLKSMTSFYYDVHVNGYGWRPGSGLFLPRNSKSDRYWGSSTPLLFCVTLSNTVELVMQCNSVINAAPLTAHLTCKQYPTPVRRDNYRYVLPLLFHGLTIPTHSSAASANRIAFRKWRNVNQDLSTRLLRFDSVCSTGFPQHVYSLTASKNASVRDLFD